MKHRNLLVGGIGAIAIALLFSVAIASARQTSNSGNLQVAEATQTAPPAQPPAPWMGGRGMGPGMGRGMGHGMMRGPRCCGCGPMAMWRGPMKGRMGMMHMMHLMMMRDPKKAAMMMEMHADMMRLKGEMMQKKADIIDKYAKQIAGQAK